MTWSGPVFTGATATISNFLPGRTLLKLYTCSIYKLTLVIAYSKVSVIRNLFSDCLQCVCLQVVRFRWELNLLCMWPTTQYQTTTPVPSVLLPAVRNNNT